jgi:hypothetical protein
LALRKLTEATQIKDFAPAAWAKKEKATDLAA